MSASEAKRVLVISPAGRVYRTNNVEWYAHSQKRIESEYFNIGDMVVYDSTLKMLNLKTVEGIEVDNPQTSDIERYKKADYIILRASNFIHNGMDWHGALDVLEKVPLPVYAVGVGAQAAGIGKYSLTGENLKFWHLVAERSKVVGVRGTFTANLLYDNGIKNVEIVGCPSILRGRNRDLRIVKPDVVKTVAFSIRREVDSTYAENPRKYLEVQREFLLAVNTKLTTTVTIHGEVEEKAFYFRNSSNMEKSRAQFLQQGWWTEETKTVMEEIYQNRLFFFLKVEDYDDFIKSQDFALGYRVHGILPALANGVPGVIVKYDSRSSELADTHAIPSIILDGSKTVDVERLIAEASFDQFNKIYALRYDKMKFVLEQNGISHRL